MTLLSLSLSVALAGATPTAPTASSEAPAAPECGRVLKKYRQLVLEDLRQWQERSPEGPGRSSEPELEKIAAGAVRPYDEACPRWSAELRACVLESSSAGDLEDCHRAERARSPSAHSCDQVVAHYLTLHAREFAFLTKDKSPEWVEDFQNTVRDSTEQWCHDKNVSQEPTLGCALAALDTVSMVACATSCTGASFKLTKAWRETTCQRKWDSNGEWRHDKAELALTWEEQSVRSGRAGVVSLKLHNGGKAPALLTLGLDGRKAQSSLEFPDSSTSLWKDGERQDVVGGLTGGGGSGSGRRRVVQLNVLPGGWVEVPIQVEATQRQLGKTKDRTVPLPPGLYELRVSVGGVEGKGALRIR